MARKEKKSENFNNFNLVDELVDQVADAATAESVFALAKAAEAGRVSYSDEEILALQVLGQTVLDLMAEKNLLGGFTRVLGGRARTLRSRQAIKVSAPVVEEVVVFQAPTAPAPAPVVEEAPAPSPEEEAAAAVASLRVEEDDREAIVRAMAQMIAMAFRGNFALPR